MPAIPVSQELNVAFLHWHGGGNRRIPAMWFDDRINDEPDYTPPSRSSLLATMRRKIGQGLQTRYEAPEDLPPALHELVAKLKEQ
jgi:hypothetical protein